ncbi:MAG TPA: dihydrofolate reductase family protein [Jiangellaceae bacterium]|nr:dihydrofolate reductase family protein [Jiangellaceae bacterium]
MRKFVVCNIMSLDGYYEGPGKNVMVLSMDASFDEYNLERIRAADTVLLGRTSYQAFSGFWPGMADNPDGTDVHREFAKIYNKLDKAVVTDTFTPGPESPWHDTTTVVRRPDVEKWLADLKQRPGREILTFGSRTLWNHLLAAGLVDELHLVVGSTVLGDGTPIFGAPVAGLKLLEAHTFAGSDNVLLTYAAAGN